MLEDYRRYPIGIQNFQQLRNNDCVYVDKTELVYRLTHTDRVYFLSRPRRFGKSLSCLRSKPTSKERKTFRRVGYGALGEGLGKLSGVAHRFQPNKYMELTDLTGQLNLFLHRWEKIYGRMKRKRPLPSVCKALF